MTIRNTYLFPIIVGAVCAAAIMTVLASPAFAPTKNENTNTNNVNTNTVVTTNTNSNPLLINTNSQTNTNTNTALIVLPAAWKPIDEPATETIVYRQSVHAFQFDAPSSWNIQIVSNGDKEFITKYHEPLMLLESPSAWTRPIEYFQLSATDTQISFDAQVAEALKAAKANDSSAVTSEATISGVRAIRLHQKSGMGEGEVDSIYFEHQGLVYQMDITTMSAAEENVIPEGFDQILSSFTFLEPENSQVVKPPEKLTKASIAKQTLNVRWSKEVTLLNISDPILTASEQTDIMTRLYYKVGDIQEGTYKNEILVNIFETLEGPYSQPNLYRAVYSPETEKLVYLEKYSDNLSYLPASVYYDTGATIAGLTMPQAVAIPNSTVKFKAEAFQLRKLLSSQVAPLIVLQNTVAGTIYYIPDTQCFVAETPDHLLQQYTYGLPFAGSYRQQESSSGMNFLVPNITWIDGTKNRTEYTFSTYSHCGQAYCLNIVPKSQISGTDKLVKIGSTPSDGDIYQLMDEQSQILKDIYTGFNNTAYDLSKKLSYDVFLGQHSVFFWEDPFGQWLQFQRADILPAVECGKPVIYLYPEQTTAVNVQVRPNGGFSVTEPDYPVGGWNVTAAPNGTLITSDGKSYESLFWEGKGIMYERPKNGFVIARTDIPAFLEKTLTKLGLNKKESGDFMDFWLPRMTNKPYYFITFVDQSAFDQIAPLQITPRPDTIIRVFMDYQGLEKPINVEPLHITTPVRTGFTVVEWGGALHE